MTVTVFIVDKRANELQLFLSQKFSNLEFFSDNATNNDRWGDNRLDLDGIEVGRGTAMMYLKFH